MEHWDFEHLKVRSLTLKGKAYKTILIPKMEYCSTIWDKRRAVESNGCHRVEMVQRRAARCVISQYQPQESVTAMIDKFGWDTLEKRSAIARVTLLYKIVKGIVVNSRENLQQLTRKSRDTKDHSFKPMPVKLKPIDYLTELLCVQCLLFLKSDATKTSLSKQKSRFSVTLKWMHCKAVLDHL
jgi:hypothetical protein